VWFAQGLRGLACLIVVWEHLAHDFLAHPAVVSQLAFAPADPGLRAKAPAVHEWILEGLDAVHVWPGAFGVALFFLISGFVIPFSLERNTIGGFFTRRFFRLYPTLWAAIGVTLAVLAVQAWFLGDAFPYGRQVIGSSGGLFGAYVGKPWVDPVYWTLAIEEIFYVLAALCAWRGVLHRRTTVVLLGVGLTAACIALTPDVPTTSVPPLWYLGTHLARNCTFVVFILIGLVFHEHYRGSWRTGPAVAVGAGLVGLYAVCLHTGPFPGDQEAAFLVSMLCGLGVFTTLYAVRERLPYVRALDWLANVSYPLYLVHTVVGWILMRQLYRVVPSFLVVVPVTVAIMIAIAAVLHRYVEVPTNRLGRRLGSRRPATPEPPLEVVVVPG
jgi:peptidoglycan/LPS O-acetylase OafA/YrhL